MNTFWLWFWFLVLKKSETQEKLKTEPKFYQESMKESPGAEAMLHVGLCAPGQGNSVTLHFRVKTKVYIKLCFVTLQIRTF